MLLERLTLENIRSYADATPIDLPTGSTLFEGDIGSGKSTILSGIEFALFGLGDVDGEFLLRSKSKRGSVTLDFRVGESKYTAYRELVRGKKHVTQGDGYLVEDGSKTEYSVGEMKSRILPIIGIKERPQAKTTSIIFRSAIFTPQEMMKQVLLEDDRRQDTLRRAYGIQEYSNAVTNSEEIRSWSNSEIRLSRELSKKLPESTSLLNEETRIASEADSEIDKLKKLRDDAKSKVSGIDVQLDKLEKDKEAVIKLEAWIPEARKRLRKAKDDLEGAEARKNDISRELQDIEKAVTLANSLEGEYLKYLDDKKERNSLAQITIAVESKRTRKEKLELIVRKEKESLQSKIEDLEGDVSTQAAEIEGDSKEIAPLESQLSLKEKLEEKLKPLQAARLEVRQNERRIAQLTVTRLSREEKLTADKEELDAILKMGIGAVCPKCKQKLSEEHIAQLKNDFKKEKSDADEKLANLTSEIKEIESQKAAKEGEVEEMESAEGKLRKLDAQISAMESKRKTIQRSKEKLERRKQELAELRKALKEGDFAVTERKEINGVEQFIRDNSAKAERWGILTLKVEEAEKDEIQPKYLTNLAQAKRKPSLEKELDKVTKTTTKATKEFESQQEELQKKENEYLERKPVLEAIRTLDAQRSKLDGQRQLLDTRLATVSAEREASAKEIRRLEAEIESLQLSRRRNEYFEQFKIWLQDCFVPAVQDIERQAMAAVNDQFNQQFQKWFNILIETGDITVEVDDAFAPVVTQGGYTLSVNSLSGGERTSLALAYRLALNVTVRSAAGLEPDLLILDEPTDGFSSEQLVKLRSVLSALNMAQIIMVSHERELETFVQNICKVTKEAGISKVEFVRR